MLDVDGSLFCSLLCFTEQTLATKRRTLRDPAAPNSAEPPATVPADPAPTNGNGDLDPNEARLNPDGGLNLDDDLPTSIPATPSAAPPPAPTPVPTATSSGPDIPPAPDAFDDVWSRLEKPAESEPAPAPTRIASEQVAAVTNSDPLADIGLDESSSNPAIPAAPADEMDQVEAAFRKFNLTPQQPPPTYSGKDSGVHRRPPVESDFNEPSIVMRAADADASPDDSSIMMPASDAAQEENTSILEMNALRKDDGTSVLDMGPVKRPDSDESEQIGSSALMSSVKKDHTSILNMSAIPKPPAGAVENMPFVIPETPDEAQPVIPAAPEDLPPREPRLSSVWDAPKAETPLPMILPGTRRSTIEALCVRHADTPAVVLCSKCGDPICTLCVTDEAHGGRCMPYCRRDDPARKRNQKFVIMAVATAALILIAVGWAFMPPKETPKQPDPVVVAPPPPPPPPPPVVIEPPPPPPVVVVPPPPPPPPPPVVVVPVPVVIPKPPPPPPPPPPVVVVPVPVVIPKPPPPPPPPPPPKPTALEVALGSASNLIREATPVFVELADNLDPSKMPEEDVRAQLTRADAVERKLNSARGEYARIVAEAPDRAKVEWRMDVLGELITTLEWGLDRVRVPRMLRQASLRIAEAMPLYRRVSGGREDARDASERAALATMSELALAKLKEARGLYVQTKAAAPEPEKIGARIRQLDELIETLEAAAPGPVDAPALEKRAGGLIGEAMPLYRSFADEGRTADGDAARAKLREARALYLRAQSSSADPAKVGARIKALDELLDSLDR